MNDLADLLAGMAGAGETVRILRGVAISTSTVRVNGVVISPTISREAAGNVKAGTQVLLVRAGATDSAHYLIATL